MYWLFDVTRPRRTLLFLLPLLVAVAIPASADVPVTAGAVDQLVNGNCSLIEAIRTFNTGVAVDACDPPTGAIVLPAGSEFVLTQSAESFAGENGLPVIDIALEIQGNGATVRRDTTAARFRLMQVNGVDVTLRDLFLEDGATVLEFGTNGSGGGIYNSGGSIDLVNVVLDGNRAQQNGGGISNTGVARLENSRVINNEAQVTGPGLWSNNDLTVLRSEVTGNGFGLHAIQVAGGSLLMEESTVARNDFGGVRVSSGATATIRNSTLHDNEPEEGSPPLPGAGLLNSGTSTLQYVTVTGNDGSSDDGIFANPSLGSVTLLNTVAADNQGTDCGGAVTSQGGNLIETNGCTGVTDGVNGDITGVDPVLGVLQDNGGPTRTQLPGEGSPLIDAAVGPGCVAADQRGVARPQGDGCEIGAVEVVPEPVEPPPMGTEDIPTLGEASLGGFWLLLALFGIYALRRPGA